LIVSGNSAVAKSVRNFSKLNGKRDRKRVASNVRNRGDLEPDDE